MLTVWIWRIYRDGADSFIATLLLRRSTPPTLWRLPLLGLLLPLATRPLIVLCLLHLLDGLGHVLERGDGRAHERKGKGYDEKCKAYALHRTSPLQSRLLLEIKRLRIRDGVRGFPAGKVQPVQLPSRPMTSVAPTALWKVLRIATVHDPTGKGKGDARRPPPWT